MKKLISLLCLLSVFAIPAFATFTHTAYTTVIGNKKLVYGAFDSGSTTGGEIVTGLGIVEGFVLTEKGSASTTKNMVINETLPLRNSTGTVTIVTDTDIDGYFMAIGY